MNFCQRLLVKMGYKNSSGRPVFAASYRPLGHNNEFCLTLSYQIKFYLLTVGKDAYLAWLGPQYYVIKQALMPFQRIGSKPEIKTCPFATGHFSKQRSLVTISDTFLIGVSQGHIKPLLQNTPKITPLRGSTPKVDSMF